MSSLNLPREVVVEVTAKCNFHCTSCFNKNSFALNGRMDSAGLSLLKKIIDKTAENKIEFIRFTGGEPLLFPELFDMIQYAHEQGLKVKLNTNASLLTPQNAALIDRYVESVLVSFNGYDSASDEKWTSLAGSFEKKIRGLELLSQCSSVRLRVGTVLTEANILNLHKIFTAIRPFKPGQWEVYREVSTGEEKALTQNIEALLNQFAFFSVQLNSLVFIANAIPFCMYDEELMNHFCVGAIADDGHSRLIVDPRGFAKPSYFINENLGRPEDIMGAWNHPFMQEIRSLEKLPPECQVCSYKEKCKGGSRFKAKVFNGDYFARDPLMKRTHSP